jgi:hypothetical protein
MDSSHNLTWSYEWNVINQYLIFLISIQILDVMWSSAILGKTTPAQSIKHLRFEPLRFLKKANVVLLKWKKIVNPHVCAPLPTHQQTSGAPSPRRTGNNGAHPTPALMAPPSPPSRAFWDGLLPVPPPLPPCCLCNGQRHQQQHMSIPASRETTMAEDFSWVRQPGIFQSIYGLGVSILYRLQVL